jgi:MoaA/NifB/PqqE/SkfB family radical SAM enzyme
VILNPLHKIAQWASREASLFSNRMLCMAIRGSFRFIPREDAFRVIALDALKGVNNRLSRLEMEARRTRVWSMPVHLTLETTLKCNLRCPMCVREFVDRDSEELNRTPDLSTELFEKIVAEVFPTAETICLSLGGEPLLGENLDGILDAIEDNGLRLSLVTNGTLLDRPGLLERMTPLLHELEISVDAADPVLFEEIRKGSRFHQVLDNARRAGEMRRTAPPPKFRYGFSFTLFRKNMTQVSPVIRLLAEVGGNCLRVSHAVIFRKEDTEQSVLNCPGEYNRLHEEASRTARECEIELLMPGPFVDGVEPHQNGKDPCHCLYLSADISRNGNVRACCHHAPPILGVCGKSRCRTLWNGPVVRQLRSDSGTADAPDCCRDCPLVDRGPATVENRKKESFAFLRSNGNESSMK